MERVTSFHVRDVELPGGAGTLALVTMDNGADHTTPTTFGVQGLRNLEQALDAVEARVRAGELAAVGLTGKPFIFAVGADLKDMAQLTTREQALEVARLGHAQFRRFGELGVPSFAYVNGAALGGGLEIALHCTYRTISSGVSAGALPECLLGLVPGWGGSYLLPNLVGPAAAVEVIVQNALTQNRMLTGPKAARLGIADVVLAPAEFLEMSMAWTERVLTG
jgi:enoyl-CoA hydratase/carnithine racemase